VAQAVKHLASKLELQSSNPSTTKKKEKEHHQQKVLVRMQRKRNPFPLLGGM
jgi:hypothetical protein